MPNFSKKSIKKNRRADSDSPPPSDKVSVAPEPKKWNYQCCVKIMVFSVIIISQICLFVYIFTKSNNGGLKYDDIKFKKNFLSI